MRQPTKTDYTIEMRDGVVEVIFNPTDSHFQWRYYLRDLVSHTLVNEWHGKTGDTGDYSPRDVVDMAYRLAADHVDKHGQKDPTLTAAAALWSHDTGRGERQARI